MRITFDLAEFPDVPKDRLEQAGQDFLAQYSLRGWDNVRCEKHGEPIGLLVSPFFANGSLQFAAKERFCCSEFEDQVAIERNKLTEWQCCPDGPRWDGSEHV
jgi:hypothetical protein